MSTTPNLVLPYLAAGQAQKHVTVNEALRTLDAVVQLSVASRAIAAPPLTPGDGERHIVATNATGNWSGHSGKVVAFQDGGWMIYAPKEGWLAWVRDEDKLLVFDGAGWIVTGAEFQNQPFVGVNTTADATNRLAVSSPATLFSHQGAGHQLKLNKAQGIDTASLVFQTGFSGRAEIGTAGTDDLVIKTSADGAAWVECMRLTASGKIGLGTSAPVTPLHIEKSSAQLAIVQTGTPGPASGGGALCYAKELPTGADDRLGFNLFGSRGGAELSYNAAGFSVHAAAAWTAGVSHPTYFRFDTTAAGSTTRTEKLRITDSGSVGIGTTTPTAKLHVAGEIRVGSYTVSALPAAAASGAGAIVHVSNESGGAVLVFSDGTSWRRVTDRAIVS